MDTLHDALLRVLHARTSELERTGKLSGSDAEETTSRVEVVPLEAIQELADAVLRAMVANAPDMLQAKRSDEAQFRKRNAERWREGFDLLETLCVACGESGADYNREWRPSASADGDYQFEAIVVLHARSTLIANEILCLMKGGFPDGALGRWRTLHELAVVARFLGGNDRELSERYLQSRHVQAYKAMRQYQDFSARAKLQPYAEEELEAARRTYEAIINRYGEAMKSDYGWAAGVLGIEKPTFSEIERRTEFDHWRPRYRWASDNTHANFKPAATMLGLSEASGSVLLIGPSNSGMTDPAHMTAISLVNATASLLLLKPNLDRVVLLKALTMLSDRIGESFLNVHSVA